MNKASIVAIIGGLIAAVIVISVLSFTITAVQDNNMCDNWSAAIEQKKADYENMNIFEKLGVDTDSMNADVNAFNQQCAYQ